LPSAIFSPVTKQTRSALASLVPLGFLSYYLLYFLQVIIGSRELGASLSVDEIFAVLLFPFAVLGFARIASRFNLVTIAFVVYFTAYFVSTAFQFFSVSTEYYPFAAVWQGTLLELKPFVYLFGFVEFLHRTKVDLRTVILGVAKVLLFLALVNSIVSIMDFVKGGPSSLLGFPSLRGPLGMVLPSGLFTHKFGSATLTMLGCISALALSHKRYRFMYLTLAVYLLIILIFHSALKELFGAVFAFTIYFLITPRRSNANSGGRTALRLIFIPFIGFFFSIVFFQIISQTISARYEGYVVSNSVRGMLYGVSAEIATDYFPLGTGAGTFASAPSRTVYYSDIYHQYGLSRYYGASPYSSSYLMDTWWPKVLGESGLFGLLAYLFFWGIGVIRLGRHFLRQPDGASFFVFTSAVAVIVSSIAASVFTSDVYLPIIGLAFATALLPVAATKRQTPRVQNDIYYMNTDV